MNQVARVDQNPISTDVRRMESQFALALPEHVSPERFVRVVVTAIQANPDLQKADRDSVLGAALKCAQDGLVPDGREAALVVYGTKATYLPMIAGILAKVRRSGELQTIAAHVVYENDTFAYTLGDDEKIEHQPLMGSAPRGKPVAVYAVAKTKDGGIYREVMSIDEVNQVRAVSRAKNAGPWVTWWGEMARKTVIRRLSKRLPMSTDLQQVLQRDDDHYDLNRVASGAAKIRRLHADFEEAPKKEAQPEPEPPTLDDALDGDDIPAEFSDAVQEPPESPPEALAEPPAFDPLEWAAGAHAHVLTLATAEDVTAFWKLPETEERFRTLDKASMGLAAQLRAAVRARRDELTKKP